MFNSVVMRSGQFTKARNASQKPMTRTVRQEAIHLDFARVLGASGKPIDLLTDSGCPLTAQVAAVIGHKCWHLLNGTGRSQNLLERGIA